MSISIVWISCFIQQTHVDLKLMIFHMEPYQYPQKNASMLCNPQRNACIDAMQPPKECTHAIYYPQNTRRQFSNPNRRYAGKFENVSLDIQDVASMVATAEANHVDLVVVGPEVPLCAGVADAMQQAHIKCFGPTQAAARLEGSKAYMKDFFQRYSLPTAEHRTFSEFKEAEEYVRGLTHPVVCKTSGLAAGKGVLIPENTEETVAALRSIMVDKDFGSAGDECVVEEFLTGEEVSVLAFCDGQHSVCMPAAQDHKRAFDHDKGPNTGGMGAYAPAPCVTPFVLDQIKAIVQQTVEALAKEGTPYVGVLFGGFILHPTKGPMLLEYNVRMGDPETQVVLPLLESDLFDIMDRCCDGALLDKPVEWNEKIHACTVVMASQGYPGSYDKGIPIRGLENANATPGVTVYHAGTKVCVWLYLLYVLLLWTFTLIISIYIIPSPSISPTYFWIIIYPLTFFSPIRIYNNKLNILPQLDDDNKILSNGGRVLSVTGTSTTLRGAVNVAYSGIGHISFVPPEKAFYRTDIAKGALLASSHRATTGDLEEATTGDLEEARPLYNSIWSINVLTGSPSVLGQVLKSTVEGVGGVHISMMVVSTVLWIQAAILLGYANSSSQTVVVGGQTVTVGGSLFPPEYKSVMAYAISSGLITMSLSAALHFKGRDMEQYLEMGLVVFQFVWWLAATMVLTFHPMSNFQTPSNGYFSLWAGLVLASVELVPALKYYKVSVLEKENRTSLVITVVASVIVLIGLCVTKGYPATSIAGLVFIGLNVLVGMGMLFLMDGRESQAENAKKLTLVMMLMYAVATILLTFFGQFSTVGNGFIALWVGSLSAYHHYQSQLVSKD